MAQTIVQNNPEMPMRMATGAVLDTGTVAAFAITLGFRPRYIKVVNVTAASTGLVSMEWIEGMTNAHGIKTNDEGTSETGVTAVTSNGITVTSTGFTIGLDTDLNVTSEQIRWIAFG